MGFSAKVPGHVGKNTQQLQKAVNSSMVPEIALLMNNIASWQGPFQHKEYLGFAGRPEFACRLWRTPRPPQSSRGPQPGRLTAS